MNNPYPRLIKLISDKKLSLIAKRRLDRDIFAICERLAKDEYETSGIVENVFDIPDKANQFYKHLDTYFRIGSSWSQVLSNFPLNNYKKILDICPGYSPKVEIALLYANFQGEVFIMDKNREAINLLLDIMKIFRPKYRLTPMVQNLFTTNNNYHFVLGNHIFDDLVLSYFCNKFNLKLDDLYAKEKILLSTWQEILNNKDDNINEICNELSTALKNIVAKDGYLCLSYYQSYIEIMLSMQKPYIFCRNCFLLTINKLLLTDFTQVKIPEFKGYNKKLYFGSKDVVILKRNNS
jgi:hypothetical protein